MSWTACVPGWVRQLPTWPLARATPPLAWRSHPLSPRKGLHPTAAPRPKLSTASPSPPGLAEMDGLMQCPFPALTTHPGPCTPAPHQPAHLPGGASPSESKRRSNTWVAGSVVCGRVLGAQLTRSLVTSGFDLWADRPHGDPTRRFGPERSLPAPRAPRPWPLSLLVPGGPLPERLLPKDVALEDDASNLTHGN